jgi:hypothetical protein
MVREIINENDAKNHCFRAADIVLCPYQLNSPANLQNNLDAQHLNTEMLVASFSISTSFSEPNLIKFSLAAPFFLAE